MSQLYIKKFDGSMLLLLRQPRIWQEVMKAIESGCKELWVDEKAENTNFQNIEGIYYDSQTKVLGIGILEEYSKYKNPHIKWKVRDTTHGRWESNGKVTILSSIGEFENWVNRPDNVHPEPDEPLNKLAERILRENGY